MSKGKIIGLSILTVFILGIGYIVYLMNRPEYQVGEIIKNPPKEYLEIFTADTRQKLLVDYALKPKYDNAICQYLYRDKFIIQEFAINVSVEKPLTEFINIQNKNDLNFTNIITNEIRGEFFTVSYKNIFPKVSHLEVSLYGNSIKTIAQNDTVVAYSSNIKNFSIKHDGSDKSAIFCRLGVYSNPDTIIPSTLPVNIAFIKRKKIVYFLVMSVKDSKTQLEANTLYNLISDKL